MSARDWFDPTRLYNPSEPAGRLLYFWGSTIYPFIIFFVVYMGAVFVEMLLGYYDSSPIQDLVTIPLYLGYFAAVILMVLRRLKDLNSSGGMVLLLFVPFVNFFVSLWLLFTPGTPKSNLASASPLQVERGDIIPQTKDLEIKNSQKKKSVFDDYPDD